MRTRATPKIIVDVGKQMDGATFRLNPKTHAFLSSRFENLRPPSSVFVSNETAADFKRYYGPLGKELVVLLTGLSEDKIEELGGFKFVDPVGGRVFFQSTNGR